MLTGALALAVAVGPATWRILCAADSATSTISVLEDDPPAERSASPQDGMVFAAPNMEPGADVSPDRDLGDLPRSVRRELELLRQRLGEVEKQRVAHEDATREIIRKTLSETLAEGLAGGGKGSKINEFVVFGGNIEAEIGRIRDFEGVSESKLSLSTAQLDFEITVNDWARGSVIFEYLDGHDVLFPTTAGDETAVDRLTVDTAFVTLGDLERCPLFATVGRVITPFGISTGDPVADVLTIESPLTVEVFETRQDVILFGFETTSPRPLPPSLKTKSPEIVRQPVPPLLMKPLLCGIAQRVNRATCYAPLEDPAAKQDPLTDLCTLWAPTSSFNGGVFIYNGATTNGGEDHIEHIGGTLGYRARGIFPSRCLPWTVDADVDVTSSVFDSRFLSFEYLPFLPEIGYVPGMAAHLKSSLGPVALVAEWNGAITHATFTDEAWDPVTQQVVPGDDIEIAPGAWQISLAYQLGWNPTVEVIGAQGTYVTLGYSESRDLAGVTRVINGEETRLGFVPQKRFLVGLGEWIQEGLRISLEYSHIVDYREEEGGTGNAADGVFAQLTYEW